MNVNDWIDGKVLKILEAFGVELPGGDGDVLRGIAGHWDAMGDTLTGIAKSIDSAVKSADDRDWSGQARQAFDAHWQQQEQTINQIAGNFHHVATGLRGYADEIDSINKSIIDICVQIAEMEIAGAVLSVFTGGISELVGNTAVAAKVAKVIDLVKLFTSAAEKVAEFLEKFFSLAEEDAAMLAKVLSTVAKVSADFAKTTLNSFVTNYSADSSSMMINQAMNGQPVTVSQDFTGAAYAAGGTALFTGAAGGLAGRFASGSRIANVLAGEGMAGTSINGAIGNVVGGLTADVHSGTSVSGDIWDAGTNALTGAGGNAAGEKMHNVMDANGFTGGKYRSDRAILADSALTQGAGTGANTSIYAAGSGIESDAKNLVKDEQNLGNGE